MKKRLVFHHNRMSDKIVNGVSYSDDQLDHEIYCRKQHLVTVPLADQCGNCGYLVGFMQGNGIECAWEDVVAEENGKTVVNRHENRYKEYERVDILIKKGILSIPTEDTLFNVEKQDFDENEWIYEQSDDYLFRFALGKKGKNPLLCFGINPSTASPNKLDQTMKRVFDFAKINGYDSAIMLNLYPYRATQPQDLHTEPDTLQVKRNIEVISEIFNLYPHSHIWAAWGTNISSRPYMVECLHSIVALPENQGRTWFTIGDRTKDGHPPHPLRMRKDSSMENFNVVEYLRKFK